MAGRRSGWVAMLALALDGALMIKAADKAVEMHRARIVDFLGRRR